MAIAFADTFRGYLSDTDASASGWIMSGSSLYVALFGTGGRDNCPYFRFNNVNFNAVRIRRSFEALGTAVVGFGFRWIGVAPGSELPFFRIRSSDGRYYAGISLTDTGQLRISTYDTSGIRTIRATSAPVITQNNWRWIDAKFVAGASGSITVRVDGQVVVAASGFSLGSGLLFDTLSFGTQEGINPGAADWDWDLSQVMIIDTNPGSLTDFPSRVPRVVGIAPTADSTPHDGTPSTGTDGAPLMTDNLDTTYVTLPAGAGSKDLYVNSNPSAVFGTILAAVPWSRMRRTDTTSATVRHVVKTADGELVSSDIVPPSDSFILYRSIFETRPGGGAWTQAKIDELESGQVIA